MTTKAKSTSQIVATLDLTGCESGELIGKIWDSASPLAKQQVGDSLALLLTQEASCGNGPLAKLMSAILAEAVAAEAHQSTGLIQERLQAAVTPAAIDEHVERILSERSAKVIETNVRLEIIKRVSMKLLEDEKAHSTIEKAVTRALNVVSEISDQSKALVMARAEQRLGHSIDQLVGHVQETYRAPDIQQKARDAADKATTGIQKEPAGD